MMRLRHDRSPELEQLRPSVLAAPIDSCEAGCSDRADRLMLPATRSASKHWIGWSSICDQARCMTLVDRDPRQRP